MTVATAAIITLIGVVVVGVVTWYIIDHFSFGSKMVRYYKDVAELEAKENEWERIRRGAK